jgi:hypothetical protein
MHGSTIKITHSFHKIYGNNLVSCEEESFTYQRNARCGQNIGIWYVNVVELQWLFR